jgi:hypothetical protein
MGGVSKDQIARAKEIRIEDYILSHEPNNVRRIGGAYYLKDHESLEISHGLWNWHSHGVGGKNVIDYLMKVRGYDFVGAVKELAGEDFHAYPITPKARPPTEKKTTERVPFRLPLRNRDNERVIAYLESRGIPKPFITEAIERGHLYETATYHNVCFIGRDESGKAKFAALRGTMGNFKRDADGSDKRYGFCLPSTARDCKTVIVFESPIDALSHKVLYPEIDGFRLSLGGTALAALTHFLEHHKEIKNITVCTDNDEAGNACAAKIAELEGCRITRALPEQGKDWNEFLTTRKEVNAMEDVRKTIIFRDSEYKEKFRIKDGDSIKVTLGYDGEVVTRKCRWIDECHTKIGNEYYHNDEYAEKSAKVGNKTEPVTSLKPKIDILAAKYGEALQDIEIPMTEAAIKKLVGGKFEAETLYYPSRTEQIKDRKVEIKGQAFGAVVRGKDGIVVCGLADGVLTSLHPYNAQTQKRVLSPAERTAQEVPTRKPSLLGDLESAEREVAERNAAKTVGDKVKKRDERS